MLNDTDIDSPQHRYQHYRMSSIMPNTSYVLAPFINAVKESMKVIVMAN